MWGAEKTKGEGRGGLDLRAESRLSNDAKERCRRVLQ